MKGNDVAKKEGAGTDMDPLSLDRIETGIQKYLISGEFRAGSQRGSIDDGAQRTLYQGREIEKAHVRPQGIAGLRLS